MKAAKATNRAPKISGATVGLPISTARPVRLLGDAADDDGDGEQGQADEEQPAGEHVRPVAGVPALLVGERVGVVGEPDPFLRLLVEERQVEGADRRDDERDGDEEQRRDEEDVRPVSGGRWWPGGWRRGWSCSPKRTPISTVGTAVAMIAGQHRAGAEVGAAPPADHEADGGTREHAVQRRPPAQQVEAGTDGCEDRPCRRRSARCRGPGGTPHGSTGAMPTPTTSPATVAPISR